nr:hypothetical protein [Acidithrix ferrooxidans]
MPPSAKRPPTRSTGKCCPPHTSSPVSLAASLATGNSPTGTNLYSWRPSWSLPGSPERATGRRTGSGSGKPKVGANLIATTNTLSLSRTSISTRCTVTIGASLLRPTESATEYQIGPGGHSLTGWPNVYD